MDLFSALLMSPVLLSTLHEVSPVVSKAGAFRRITSESQSINFPDLVASPENHKNQNFHTNSYTVPVLLFIHNGCVPVLRLIAAQKTKYPTIQDRDYKIFEPTLSIALLLT